MELFKIKGTIAVTNDEANAALDETTEKASGTHGKISNAFGRIGNAALAAGKVVAVGMGAIATAFGTLGTLAVKYNAEMEQYQTSFGVMLGSEEEALKLVEDLKETAAKTPFEMTDLASTTQLLMNYGLEADAAKDSLMMLGDISQGSADKLQRIATAYGQMSSSGKVTMEDIKQMIEAGFNPLQEISESTGESMESLYDRISKGTISVDEITASMERATSEGGKYFGSMEKQSQTFTGKLSTLKDTINSALGKAFESVSGILTEKVLPRLTELAETYIPKLGIVVEQLIPPIMQIAETALPLIISTVDMLLPMFVQFIEQMLPVLGSTLTTIIPLLLQVAQQILPILLQTISETIPALLPLVEEILPILAELLMILLPPLAELLPVALNFLIPILLDLCDTIKTFIIPAIEMLVDWLGPVLADTIESISLVFEGFGKMISGLFESIVGNVEFYLAIFKGDWQGALDAMSRSLGGALKFVVGLIQTVIPGLIVWFKGKWGEIKAFFTNAFTWAKNGFNQAKTFVTTIFTSIYNTIKGKINSAVSFVKNGIDKLKSFFDFDWELPKLKMPHFKIEGSFSLDPPSVPSFGIDWYAKGAVLNKPTAFGMNGNDLMVGGEAGPEAIAPIATLQKYVTDAVASQNAELVDVLYKILAAILAMDGNMGENLREALANTSLDIDRRTFARLVKAVN